MRPLTKKILVLAKEREFLPKGISLLLAVVLWALISSSNIETRRFRIPIIMKNLPSYLAVAKKSNRYIMVNLEGKQEILNSVNVKNIRAEVNLEDAVIGQTRLFPVRIIKQNIPENIKITPSLKEISIAIDKKDEKWVKIKPDIAGNIKRGGVITGISVVPDRVLVTGPHSVVNDIDFVLTDKILLQNETGDITRLVSLKRDELNNVHFNETRARVSISILEGANLYGIKVDLDLINSKRVYRYDLDIDEVKVYIKMSDKDKVERSDIRAIVDVGSINPQLLFKKLNRDEIYKEMPVQVAIKNRKADIVSVLPARVMVKIIKR